MVVGISTAPICAAVEIPSAFAPNTHFTDKPAFSVGDYGGLLYTLQTHAIRRFIRFHKDIGLSANIGAFCGKTIQLPGVFGFQLSLKPIGPVVVFGDGFSGIEIGHLLIAFCQGFGTILLFEGFFHDASGEPFRQSRLLQDLGNHLFPTDHLQDFPLPAQFHLNGDVQ